MEAKSSTAQDFKEAVSFPVTREAGASVVRVRNAEPADAGLLRQLVVEMGRHHGVPVLTSEDRLAVDGFGAKAKFRALIAEVDGEVAGYALFFDYYSSFRGVGIFLEDLFVRDKFRSEGIGKELLSRIAEMAMESNCFGIMLNVLDWNQPALRFFKSSGASVLTNYQSLCLSGEALRGMANKCRLR